MIGVVKGFRVFFFFGGGGVKGFRVFGGVAAGRLAKLLVCGRRMWWLVGI